MDLIEAKQIALSYGINITAKPYLISKPTANKKVEKNMKLGVLTSPLHLAPADMSGYNTCSSSTEGCREVCIHKQGNPAYMQQKEKSRIAKTKLYFEERDAFLTLLVDDMSWLKRKAERMALKPAIRMNATSDVPWERIKHNGTSITDIAHQQGITVYDYTKVLKRALSQPYHITFSRTEDNDADCVKVLKAKRNVAVVFHVTKKVPLPTTWKGYRVVSGDDTDWRPSDDMGVVVGLMAKGTGRQDMSGFVIR